MNIINDLKEKVLSNHLLTKEEVISLTNVNLDNLCSAANDIRTHFCGKKINTCTILNGKSGLCTENCKYCAQSAHNHACIDEYPLMSADEIISAALENARLGVDRFSVVTAGERLNDNEITTLCHAYTQIKKSTNLELCSSNGLLSYEQFARLHNAGVTRIHNNLETSRRFFPYICTTHTYDDKLNAIYAAKLAGMEICSGGIIGMGETMEDRIDMAFELRSLGVQSIPINILMPISGIALENQPPLNDNEILRTVAIFRFINPAADIRFAGGRKLLNDRGKRAFKSGANASIVGNMLTSVGNSINEDFSMFKELGFIC